MTKLLGLIKAEPKYLYFFCIFLLIPAFWLNLGIMPLIADEPIRGLVALEMLIRDNWIVPTLNGALYFNKPPFYNWLIIGCIEIFNNASEWVIRLPSVVPLFLYACTIYLAFKKEVGRKVAFLSAVFYMTCGRLLIYASLLGHIDVFYSWITFISFIVIFRNFRNGQWLRLFTLSYLLAAISFLCKGMPSVVFQGLTLLGWFTYKGHFRKLFTWQHLAGGLIFLSIIGGYAFLYNLTHPIEDLMATLWSQSSKRTMLAQPWYETALHLIIFPFEVLYHILPWSLLVIFTFRKQFLSVVMGNELLAFSFITFLINIIIYWLAPQTYPRYIFMLYPFLFLFTAYFYERFKTEDTVKRKVVESLLLVTGIAMILVMAAVLILPGLLHPELSGVEDLIWKASLLLIGLVIAVVLFMKVSAHRMVIFTLVLLLGRIGFDWFILPVRAENADYARQKHHALKIAELTKNEPLHVYEMAKLDLQVCFYITRERNELLNIDKPSEVSDTGDYYLINDYLISRIDADYKTFYKFNTVHQKRNFYLVKFKNPLHITDKK